MSMMVMVFAPIQAEAWTLHKSSAVYVMDSRVVAGGMVRAV